MKKFQIALNDTLETRLLATSMLVNIAYLKYPSIKRPCKEEYDCIKYAKIFHGVVAKYEKLPDVLSDDFIDNVDIEKTKYFFDHSNYPIISIHIGDNLKNLSDEECIENAIKNIEFIKDALKNPYRDILVALENMEILSNLNTLNPYFIKRLIKATNCKFLLDTAHATIAAHLLNMNVYDYITELPLEDVVEIHFSGTAYDGDYILSHIKAREEDYELLEYVLNIANPDVITIEYGLYDTHYKRDILNTLPKVSYSQINITALNEILYMYYRVDKLRQKN